MMKRFCLLLTLVLAASLLTACPAPTAQIVEVEKPVVVEKEVVHTVEVIKEVAVEKVVKETVEVVKEVPVEVVVTATPETARLTFWHVYGESHPAKPGIDARVAAFNETHPYIQVEALQVPGGEVEAKLLAAIAGGNPPDVAMVDGPWIASWAERDALMPLDEFAGEVNEDDYYPSAWTESHYKGKMYSLPHNTDVNALLFWNKDHFAEAGLDPDQPPATIAELKEFAQRLDKYDADGNLIRAGFIPWVGIGQFSFIAWAGPFGATVFDNATQTVMADEPQFVKLFEWAAGWADDYGLDQLDTFVGSFKAGAFGFSPDDPFYSGQLSMVIGGDWVIGLAPAVVPDLNFGVAAVPYLEDGGEPNSANMGGFHLVAPRGTKDLAAAWEFMKDMASKEAQEEFTEAVGVLPVLKDAALPTAYRDPAIEPIIRDLAANSYGKPQTPIGAELLNRLDAAFAEVHQLQAPAQETLDRLTEEMQDELDLILRGG